jgi:hypothetical protein
LAESLAGRATFLDLRGFSLQELAGAGASPCWLTAWLQDPRASIERARQTNTRFTGALWEWLWRGFLPRVDDLDEELVPEFWMSYHRTYVERGARMMANAEDWQQFGMFLRLVAALTAQEINYSQLGREIGMSPPDGPALTEGPRRHVSMVRDPRLRGQPPQTGLLQTQGIPRRHRPGLLPRPDQLAEGLGRTSSLGSPVRNGHGQRVS